MRTAKQTYLLLLLPLALSQPACRGMVKEMFKTPKVRVIDVMLASNPLDDPMMPWDFTLRLEVNNRNDYPLEISYVAYSAIVGRETVAGGEHRAEIRIGASGITVVKVPISIRPQAVLSAGRDALIGRSVTYEFNGSVGIRTQVLGVVRIPFSKTGGFDPADFLKRKGFDFN